MKVRTRGSAPIEKIIIHDPEGANTARELGNFLAGIDAGYHSGHDDRETITYASDDLIVQGAGGMNTHALHACVVPGRAAWSREQWLVHRPAIERMGRWIGEKSRLHAIPLRILTPREMATSGVKGVGTHGIVSAAAAFDPIFLASDGHTDPGPNFPLDVCMAAAGGTVPSTSSLLEPTMIVQRNHYDADGKPHPIPDKNRRGKWIVATIAPSFDGRGIDCDGGASLFGDQPTGVIGHRRLVPDDLRGARVVSTAEWEPAEELAIPGVVARYSDGRTRPFHFS